MAAIPPLELRSRLQPNATTRFQVAHGTDKEEVLIGKPLSLIGQHAENSIIDATGRSNGIDIYGMDNAGLAKVVGTKFSW